MLALITRPYRAINRARRVPGQRFVTWFTNTFTSRDLIHGLFQIIATSLDLTSALVHIRRARGTYRCTFTVS